MMASASVWGSTEPGEYDWVVASSDYSKEQDAFSAARNSVDKLNAGDGPEARGTRSFQHSLFYIYEHEQNDKVENIATPMNLQTICKLESEMPQTTEYKDYCALKKNGQCANMTMSFPLLYYGMDHDWTCPLLGQNEVDKKTQAIIDTLDSEAGLLQYGFFLDKDVKENGFPSKLRSMIQLGSPLEGYSSETDELTAQNQKYVKFFKKWKINMFDFMGITSMNTGFGETHVKDGIEVRYWGFDLQQLEFQNTVNFDMMFSMGSLVFVYVWIWVHVGSYFLASIGMLQIVASLPIGNAIYRQIFQIDYFDTLHTLVIFLVLGIGADDVFVLVDAWKQTANLIPREEDKQSYEEYLAKRMTIAYSRTAHAVFNTSFTAAMAFIATAISPIMPISTFGIYAALVILLNYLMVISVTPTALLVYEVYVSKWRVTSCQCSCEGGEKREEAAVPRDAGDGDAKEPGRDGVVEKVFDNFYLPLFLKGGKIIPIISIAIALAWGIFAGTCALKMEPPREQEKWFKDSHMFTGTRGRAAAAL